MPGYPPAGMPYGMPMGPIYAGFGSRFVGFIIDIILLAIPIGVLVSILVAGELSTYTSGGTLSGGALFGIYLVAPLLIAGYFTLTVALMGGTIGQKVMSLRVADAASGQRATYMQAFLRSIIFWVQGVIPIRGVASAVGLACLVGMLWVAWDPMKQGLHDKLAKTVVVKN
jgi:uncharacterized RDD family membrane protein YckC